MFDANPQAVYHGAGFGELQSLGTSRFDIDTSNAFRAPDSGQTFAVARLTADPNRMVGVRVSGGDAGVDHVVRFFRAGDFPTANVTTSTVASDSNGVRIRIGGESLFLGRNAAGNLMAASSAEGNLGGANFVVTLYEVH